MSRRLSFTTNKDSISQSVFLQSLPTLFEDKGTVIYNKLGITLSL